MMRFAFGCKYMFTGLDLAAYLGVYAAVQILCRNNPDPIDCDEATPLYYACMNGYKGVVKLLLQKGANVNSKGLFKRTPLFDAVAEGYERIVKLLLKNGADISLEVSWGETALSNATKRGDKEVIKLLLENGAGVDVKDNEGQVLLP